MLAVAWVSFPFRAHGDVPVPRLGGLGGGGGGGSANFQSRATALASGQDQLCEQKDSELGKLRTELKTERSLCQSAMQEAGSREVGSRGGSQGRRGRRASGVVRGMSHRARIRMNQQLINRGVHFWV